MGSIGVALEQKKINVFVWGFCGATNNIVDDLRIQTNLKIWNISDHSSAELNIIDCFRRKMPAATRRSSRFRKDMQQYFLTFKETYSRHWYPIYISDEEYQSYFEYYIDYFTELIDQNNFSDAIFANIPHEGPDFVVYNLFKLQCMKTIIFYQSIFSGRSYISNDLNIFNDKLIQDYKFKYEVKDNRDKLFLITKNAINSVGNWFSMKRMKISSNFTLAQLKRNARRHFKRNIFLMIKLLFKDLSFFIEYHQYNKDKINLAEIKYVYFPFHLQPELTTSILGGRYVDQIYTLKKLSAIIPEDIFIVVKENPYQNGFKRPHGYFKKVSEIKNIKMLPMSYSSVDLIQHAQGVATITGTCGWEAICLNRPVLIFGTAWYQKLEGVFDYHKKEQRDSFLKFEKNDFNVAENTLNFLTDYSFEAIVNHDYVKIYPQYDPVENSKRLLRIININLSGYNV